MSEDKHSKSRRDFIRTAGVTAAGSAAAMFGGLGISPAMAQEM
ncbi:MAG TPA: twin-arginine translocation signal domain-containing protein, partial [Kaistia sp.]|nr:twin-arginine translocation signal domain-containing protein [Kaistia sp.]